MLSSRPSSGVMSPRPRTTSGKVKFSVFLGIYLLRVLDGIPWIWGNLAVYVTSFYATRDHVAVNGLANWLFSSNVIGFSVGMLFGGPFAHKIGLRATFTAAILVFNAGVLLSYYTINYSIVAFCATFGALTGLCGGIIESCQLAIIVRWTKRYRGLSTSSVPSSNVLGAVAVNFMMTLFINPDNKEPDSMQEELQIFTQSDVVDRVPYAFLLFGGVSLVLNLIGCLLVRESPGRDNIIRELLRRLSSSSQERIPLRARSSHALHEEIIICSHEENQDDRMARLYNMQFNPDLTPRQVLKRREFYALWTFVVVQTYAFFVLNTYYKEFGLIYIPDDHFLTAVVMVKCLCTPVCSWIAGFVMDKHGTKFTIVLISTIFSVVASFFYLTPFNKWMYMVSCVAYGCSLFTLYCLTSAGCFKLFGESHFTTILGMTLTSNYVLTLVLPFLLQWIISTYGWFVLFISAGALATLNVLILTLFLPERTMLEEQRYM